MRGALVGICAGIVALLALPEAALATTQQASSGDVTAVFSFTPGHAPDNHLHLKITNAGRVLLDAAVSSRLCTSYCVPLSGVSRRPSVRVLDLESNGRPDVVLALYTGGAHCCEVDQVYTLAPGGTSYRMTERSFGNGGAAIRDLARNGRFEFLSTDNAFYYAFTSYVMSGAPIQIWSFRAARFVDVTRRYPKQIDTDAKGWWRAFTHHLRAGEGFIAAWAADEDLLGHYTLVKNRLAREASRGHLRSDQAGAPAGRRFVAALQRFLRRLGYIR